MKNRVKESGLISLDISSIMPDQQVIEIDLKEQLWKELVLKEREYRSWIKTHCWEKYQNKAVFIHCSSNAIIPSWAYLLILSSISNYSSTCILGSKQQLIRKLIRKKIDNIDLIQFENKRIILKGCSNAVEKDFAFFEISKVLIPVVKSLMYGEACSNVPIYKKRSIN